MQNSALPHHELKDMSIRMRLQIPSPDALVGKQELASNLMKRLTRCIKDELVFRGFESVESNRCFEGDVEKDSVAASPGDIGGMIGTDTSSFVAFDGGFPDQSVRRRIPRSKDSQLYVFDRRLPHMDNILDTSECGRRSILTMFAEDSLAVCF